MKFFSTAILSLLLLSFATTLHATDALLDAGRAATIDVLLSNAVRRGMIAGGIVAVGNHSGQLFSTAQGRMYPNETAQTISEHTRFDIASLTKVIATAPAIMKLLEDGKINLLDPLSKWFPEFEGTNQEEITILNLLTHTSGLNDVEIQSDVSMLNFIKKVTFQNSTILPGNRFRYADINFILLGELVARVSGKPLNKFCAENIYSTLNMQETGFLPQFDLNLIAPTAGENNILSAGVVQDGNAKRLGGVAGHAGIFTNISDLNKFATMILNKGKYHGSQVYTERVITQMTSPYFYSSGKIIRGLGWDINSPFSSPKGHYFSDMSFGHTGYSGSSIWIDPEQDLYVILLTVRVDYKNIHQFNQLRSDISSLAVSIFSTPSIAEEIIEGIKTPETLIP